MGFPEITEYTGKDDYPTGIPYKLGILLKPVYRYKPPALGMGDTVQICDACTRHLDESFYWWLGLWWMHGHGPERKAQNKTYRQHVASHLKSREELSPRRKYFTLFSLMTKSVILQKI